MNNENGTNNYTNMSKIQRATGTPDKILTGYGTVRSAELKAIYTFLERLPDSEAEIPLSGIESRFGKPIQDGGHDSSHIVDCIKFMHSLDLIERTAQDVIKPINRTLYPSLSFETRLLYHIRSQSEDDKYQLAEVHDLLMSLTDTDHTNGFRRVSEDQMLERTRDKSRFDIRWTPEKVSMWANLLAPIGAISYSSEHDEILSSPTRVLLHELLSYHQINADDPEGILPALEWIHNEFIPIFYDVKGAPRLHIGVADTLESMVEDDVLELIGMTDVTQTVRLPKRIDKTAEPARFVISDAPDEPAYWHPLDRSERRVIA